jgi:hypothetical protein
LLRLAELDIPTLNESQISELRSAIAPLVRNRFGLAQAAQRYPAMTTEWLLGRGGSGLAPESWGEYVRLSGGEQHESVIATAIEGMDAQTRADLVADLGTLVENCSGSIARAWCLSDACIAARHEFEQLYPSAFTSWLLDPLEAIAGAVNETAQRLQREGVMWNYQSFDE